MSGRIMEINVLTTGIGIFIIIILLLTYQFKIIGSVLNYLNSDRFFKTFMGKAMFIEAGLLFSINCGLLYYFYVTDYQNIQNIISLSASTTDTLAILASLILSLGFMYWIGHFMAVRIFDPEANYGSSGILREHIIPFGALFFIVFFLPLLWMFLSKFYIIQYYIVLNTIFVFSLGFVNEYIMRKFNLRT